MLAAATVAAGTLFAAPAKASTPPKKALLVDVAHGSIGGLTAGGPSSSAVRLWGLPDYSGPIESPKTQELLWSRSASTSRAWAVVTLKGSGPVIATIRYGGPFRTAKGDRRGVSLVAFRRRWGAAKAYPVVRKGVVVEYNVPVGRVVFAFDARQTLQAVAVAPGKPGLKLCVIPTLCVDSALG